MYDRKIKNYSNFFKVLSNDVRIKILFELAFSNKNYTYLFSITNYKNYFNNIMNRPAIPQRSYRFADDMIKNQIVVKNQC